METSLIIFAAMAAITILAVAAGAIWNSWTGSEARFEKIIAKDTSDYSSLNELPEPELTPVPRRTPIVRNNNQMGSFL